MVIKPIAMVFLAYCSKPQYSFKTTVHIRGGLHMLDTFYIQLGFIQFVTCYIRLYSFFLSYKTFGIKLSVSSVIIEQLLSFVPKIND